MKIMKFEGASMRDAIAKVKAELGDQAVIVSSRQVRRGLLGNAVEISAAVDDDASEPAFTRAAPRREETQDVERLLAPLRNELRSLRALMRTSAAPAEPKSSKLEAEVATLRRLVEQLQAPAQTDPPSDAPLVAPSTARVIMLVGPTGAGKTTTIAKLAANAALVEGRRVQLVTLDTYRVGGVEQIQIFANLIGVPLAVVPRANELAAAIDPQADLTLIDTAGRSPRDTAAIAELAAAIGTIAGIETHVVVPASTSAAGIDQLVARYAALAPARLLFTKVDEQDATPELVRAPRRTRLPITWLATGQAVPEDLEQPTAARVGEIAARGLTRNHRAA